MKIGIYQSYWGRVGGGQRYIGVVADVLARTHDVEIVHHQDGFRPEDVEEPMDVDLSHVRFRHVPRKERPQWTGGPFQRLRQEREWGREISAGYDLFIDSSDNIPYFCHAKHGVLLTHFPLVTFDEFHGDSANGRHGLKKRIANAYHHIEWKKRFATYDAAIVNSEFTGKWLSNYWGLESQVLCPPLREGLSPGEKVPQVLTVGAFHSAQHKKHESTLQAFQQLCDLGVAGWNYVMVGACGDSAEDKNYVDHLRQIAANYPIEIRTDVSGEEIKSLFETSSILWHAMGYGVDAEKSPGKMEHFGMVATEAMAAGMVPVVFNGGGLREIVTHGEDGFLWSTVEELVETTRTLASSPNERARISQAAVSASRRYNTEAFESRLADVLSPFLHLQQDKT